MIVRARLPLILTALLALVLSSARWSGTAAGAAATAQKEPTYRISAIKMEQNADEFQLRIQGNAPPTYTMYELFEPLRVIIDVADAALADASVLPTDVTQGPILQVNTQVLHEQEPAITRVEIVLAEDRGYSVERRGNDILISFAKEVKSDKVVLPKSKKAKAAAASTGAASAVQVETGGPVATILREVVVDTSDALLTRVFLRANGPISKYKKAEIKKTATRPDRMYIDISGVKLPAKSLHHKVGTSLAGVRAAQRNGTVRVVFDSGLTELFAYDVQPQPDGMVVTIAAPADAATLAAAPLTTPVSAAETAPPQPADEKSLSALLLAAENAEELIKPVLPPLKKTATASSGPPITKPAKGKKTTAKKAAKGNVATDTYSFAGYTKQRISVDFYKIDLHNVFRLFGEISGQNIVVDEAVSGTLTLALNEVPWDFALDIILNLKDLQKEERFSTIVIAPKSKQLAWPKAATQNIAISADGGEKLEPISITQRIETPKGVIEAKAIIREASALDSKGDYAAAMVGYEKALALWPDNGQLAGRMATICLIHLGQNAKAAHYAKAAFAADPTNLNAALQAAIALANMKKVPEAKEYFDKAINSDQAARESLLSYAAFAEEYNSYNGALALLKRHMELHGDTLDSMVATARLLDKKGDRPAAAEQYRTVLLSGYALPADLQQYIKGRIAAAENM